MSRAILIALACLVVMPFVSMAKASGDIGDLGSGDGPCVPKVWVMQDEYCGWVSTDPMVCAGFTACACEMTWNWDHTHGVGQCVAA